MLHIHSRLVDNREKEREREGEREGEGRQEGERDRKSGGCVCAFA